MESMMEDDYIHIYESVELKDRQVGEASADASCKSSIEASLYEQYQSDEHCYSDQQRQTTAQAQVSSSVSGGEMKHCKPSRKAASHVKRCLATVALVVVVTVLILATAMSALAMFKNNSTTNLTSEEVANRISNKLNKVRNEYQAHTEDIMDLVNTVNYLNGQLSLVRNESQEMEKDLTNKVDQLCSKLNMVRIKFQETERDLTDKVNLLRNESQETELHLNNKLDQLSGQLGMVRRDLQETETNQINKLVTAPAGDNISQVVTSPNIMINNNHSLCGAGLWYPVAFLNMSDPSQQCPSAWRLASINGVRACGRPATSGSSCPGMFYSASSAYQRVCGRVIGYQNGSPDGFPCSTTTHTINNAYIDGVSITYGQQRNHIWSFVAGVTESRSAYSHDLCPCSSTPGYGPESFVGDNYYCESGNPTNGHHAFYSSDKLWDGEQCEGTCCSGTKSPPWFSVRLPNPTTESIEVRICGDEGTSNEDTPIELLEIFVQ